MRLGIKIKTIQENMDIQLKKKPWFVRYRYALAGGVALVGLLAYVLIQTAGPRRLRVQLDELQTAQAVEADFLEYVDVEGVVQPIMTLMVNAREGGNVERIVAEDGRQMKKGDTILVLTNATLMYDIEDQRNEWEKQCMTYREQELEMEQKSLTLKQQTLNAEYELKKIRKSYALEKEEYDMGIRSKAQLEVAEDEYHYKMQSTRLQLESLRSDSAMNVIRRDLLSADRARGQKALERSLQRMEDLVVRAPADGQLSFVSVTLGQQVGVGQQIAAIKVTDRFKVHASLNEYYVDRITTGLPATISYQGKKYALRVSNVVPEVKERTFEVDFVFMGEMPDNVRLGKSFRVQIELGQPEKALVLARGNFYQQTGGRWIYKLNAEKTRAVKVPVSIGRQNPEQYEILEGLQPGDWVIITGYDQFGDVEELVF